MSLNLCDSCCADCRHEREPNEIIVQCGAYKPPQSNADHIRSMSDKELTEFLASAFCAGMSAEEHGDDFHHSFPWTLDWLHQPAEGVHDGR